MHQSKMQDKICCVSGKACTGLRKVRNKFVRVNPFAKLSRKQKEELSAYAFIAPQFIGVICFIMIPVIAAIILCFTEWDFLSQIKFVGLENLKTIFEGNKLGQALGNTLVFALGIIPITIVISLSLALLSNGKIRGLELYKGSLFLPMATASVAITLVWYWIFAPNIGIINYLLSLFKISGPIWLKTRVSAKWAVIIMSVWQNMGYYYLIFLAGLKGIPRDHYEAAAIDGANGIKRFYRITLPMLSPTIFFVIITMSINILNLFQEPSVLTEGGPEFATYSIVMYIYDLAFKFFRMGEAAVVSVILFIIVGLITFIQFKLSRKWVYQGED